MKYPDLREMLLQDNAVMCHQNSQGLHLINMWMFTKLYISIRDVRYNYIIASIAYRCQKISQYNTVSQYLK